MNKKGFSLIELLVVIVLIAIISIVAFVNFGNQAPKGRNSVRLNDLSTITTAIELARADKEYSFVTPAVDGGQSFNQGYLDKEDKLKTYLAKAPRDPSATGSTNTYKIWGSITSYQLAAALEAVGEGTNLGAYNTVRKNAVTVGNFIPTATFTVTDGVVVATSTWAANTLSLIAKAGVDSAAYSGITNVTTGAASLVVDGSINLPY